MWELEIKQTLILNDERMLIRSVQLITKFQQLESRKYYKYDGYTSS